MEAFYIEILDSSDVKIAQLDRQECSCIITHAINGEYYCTITYPIPPNGIGEDKSAYLQTDRNQIRVRDVRKGTYQIFVITKYISARASNGTISVITIAEHKAISEFNTKCITKYGTVRSQLPETVLTKILSYTGYSVGTVDLTTKIAISRIGYERVMSAFQKLLTACGGEYQVDDVAGEIDILTQLGSNNNVKVFAGKNLDLIKNTKYLRNIVNKMYAVGGGEPPVTIAGARHEVLSIATATITCVGNLIVPENDSWNTYKIRFVTGAEAGNSFTISDCTSGTVTDTIVLSSTPSGVVPGDKFVITTSGDVDVDYIRAGSSISAYGTIEDYFRDSRYLDNTNLVNYPFLDGTYGSGLCAGWTKEGTPTVEENNDTDYIEYGEASQKITASSANQGISQNITVVSGKYYFIAIRLYISSGTVKLTWDDGTNISYVTVSGTGWKRMTITEKVSGTTLKVSILSSGGAATFYVDAATVCEGVLERSFVSGNDQKTLWDAACLQLKKVMNPQVEYEIDFIDLFKIDPASYPYDEVSLGDTITIDDPELGISNLTARAQKVIQDVFNPEKTKTVVSNI